MTIESKLTSMTKHPEVSQSFFSTLEGFAWLHQIGIDTPHSVLLTNLNDLSEKILSDFPGDQIVLKVEDPVVQHKSDVGGVRVVPKSMSAVHIALSSMFAKFSSHSLQGILLQEFVAHSANLRTEMLASVRWTHDMGAVVSFGPGGVYTEFLGKHGTAQGNLLCMSPHLPNFPQGTTWHLPTPWAKESFLAWLLRPFRGQPPALTLELFTTLLQKLALLLPDMPEKMNELEINPIVVHQGRWMALDVLARRGESQRPLPPPRPCDKIDKLLHPRSIAVIGVSERHQNPGRVMLHNLLSSGYPASAITIIKDGPKELDGCRCVPHIADLTERFDLVLLSVEAAQVPDVVGQFLLHDKAESLVVIPGGFDEKAGASSTGDLLRQELWASRSTASRGPVLNGGNCVGVRSRSGHYDTLFIPQYKLPAPQTPVPVALLSQSGAFLVSSLARWQGLEPLYAVSVGNQMDLTLGDYLTTMAERYPDIECFAVYAEGFQPLDGLRFFQAASKIRASGRYVCLYVAGRTQAGAQATASHTASIAGDYAIAQALAQQTGVWMADTFDDLTAMIAMFCRLRDKKFQGFRLAGISNAGFECVVMADRLDAFTLATLSAPTQQALRELFRAHHVDGIVDVHNPLDLTPMIRDQGWTDAARIVLHDPNVDVAIFGCVPLTPALQTLPKSPHHPENLENPEALAAQWIALRADTSKAWIAVIEGGDMYAPLARVLEQHNIPTFRSMDDAVRLFSLYGQMVSGR